MLTSLILAHLCLQAQDGQILTRELTLPMPANSSTQLILREFVDPIKPAVQPPKKFGESQVHRWFDWCIQGLASSPGYNRKPYFIFYSQDHKLQGDLFEPIARMYMRLWDFNYKNLKLTHNPEFLGGVVEVFVCNGGKPGGEQLLDVQKLHNDKTGKDDEVKVNTIYLYDFVSGTDPVEMAREVAHEYGHATIPGVGGYSEPEDWANGYLGEKLYLRMLRNAMVKGELGTFDSMGATIADLNKWIAANVDPLIEKAAQTLPTDSVMSDKSKAGMDEYIGLSLYFDTLYGDKAFARSMNIGASYDAKDFPPAEILAAEEPERLTLNIPPYLYGKLIWIPLGSGKLPRTTILKKDPSGWVQIKAGPTPVLVYNSR